MPVNANSENSAAIGLRTALGMCVFSALIAVVIFKLLSEGNPVSTADAQLTSSPASQIKPSSSPIDRRNAAGSDATDDSRRFHAQELINISVYENVNRSVVNIDTKTHIRDSFLMLGHTAEGSGSGSIIDRRGHILTNHHVINGAEQIAVTLADGNMYEAKLVGSDPQNDIAILKIDAPQASLIPVVFGESSNLKVGQQIFAIGNPFGLERTLTTGIISSLNRTLPARKTGTYTKGIIQIDAALNQGNSGGPLLDTDSRLIGMNTAIANPSKTGESTGVGFAIPVNTIKRVIPELIEFGRVIRADLGIAVTFETSNGLGIAVVDPKGPADRAGLRGMRIVVEARRRGPYLVESRRRDFDYADTLLAIDETPVRTLDDLQTILETKKPGDKVVVKVLREKKVVNVPVTLGEE